jgi:hypothetical protein
MHILLIEHHMEVVSEKRTGLRVSANRSHPDPKQHSMEKVFNRRRLRGAKTGVSSEFESLWRSLRTHGAHVPEVTG